MKLSSSFGVTSRAVALLSISVLICVVAASVYSQAGGSWVDPSPHKVSLIAVEKDVRLEVLDWGGKGKAVVLLAGGGNTAHAFDDFAPQLTNHYHVYGITRRGFGASNYTGTDYTADRLGDDVVTVLDALKLTKPVLVGHSLGGLELSSIASRYPNRIAGAVYLEAAYPYAFDNGKGPRMSELQGLEPRPPSPGPEDLASFTALAKWNVRMAGITLPESELRQLREVNADGTVGKRRVPQAAGKMRPETKKFTTIPVQALVIFAAPHQLEPWLTTADPATQQAAEKFSELETSFVERQAKAIEEAVRTARVVKIAGANHLIYLSNQSEVLREMRAFINRL